jgi:phosphoribosylaminoimidazole-succinocarboxamide synthase
MQERLLDHALSHPFTQIDLPLSGKRSGKVRDIYPLPGEELLLVTTDRLSAFDRVLGSVPYKGQILNQLSAWWFEKTRQIIPSHVINVPDPNVLVALQVDPLPVEVVVRGYITGVTKTALWYRYNLGERVIYGHELPEGLQKNQSLPKPIITPTTKGGPGGHDERLTCKEVVSKGYLDAETWDVVQEAALEIFDLGQRIALQAGLILVDTKYEFGHAPDGSIMIIDEVHTPDSSRFWISKTYAERYLNEEEPENFDKEFVRLEYARQGYRGDGDPPSMPQQLWRRVAQRYIQLYERLIEQEFQPGEYPVGVRVENNLRSEGIL